MRAASKMTTAHYGKLRRMKWLFFPLLLFLFWIGLTVVKQQLQMHEHSKQMEIIQEKLASEKKKNAHLESEVKQLDDSEYIANLARSFYKLGKPGEIPIQIK